MGSLRAPLNINDKDFERKLNDEFQELYQEASSGWVITNKTADRTLDCDCDDALIVGDVLGTLIADLIKKGILES